MLLHMQENDQLLFEHINTGDELPEHIIKELAVNKATVTPWWWGLKTLLKVGITTSSLGGTDLIQLGGTDHIQLGGTDHIQLGGTDHIQLERDFTAFIKPGGFLGRNQTKT